MFVGQRIRQRLEADGISQSELARRVGMSQSAMNNLIAGRSRSSTLLHAIARELKTTPAYLAGETNDPDSNAPAAPVPRQSRTITMQVSLPDCEALTAMFNGLLRNVDLSLARGDVARQLAELLPIGLETLADWRPDPLDTPHPGDHASAAPSDAMRHPVPQP